MKPLVLVLVLVGCSTSAEALDRQNVVEAMSALRPAIDACYARYRIPGLAVVDVTIAPAGIIARATIGYASDFGADSPTAACVVRAVYGARFAPFEGAAQTLAYPFVVGR